MEQELTSAGGGYVLSTTTSTSSTKVFTSKSREIVVHPAAHSDRWFGTHDGIAAGGQRLCDEIAGLLERAKREGKRFRHLSVLGHSLGGVYLRYALKLLWEKKLVRGRSEQHHVDDEQDIGGDGLPSVELCTFLTLATPHCGIRRPTTRNAFNGIFLFFAANTGNRTQRELCLQGDVLTTSTTSLRGSKTSSTSSSKNILLHQMGTDEAFLSPLRAFRRRVLYANVFYDVLVTYCTSSLRPFNPYRRGAGDPGRGRRSTHEEVDLTPSTTSTAESCSDSVHPAAKKQAGSTMINDNTTPSSSSCENDEFERGCEFVYLPKEQRQQLFQEMDGAVGARAFAQNDRYQVELQEMMTRLNSMSWDRVDVNMKSMKAHWLICGQMENTTIVRHVARNFTRGIV